MTASGSRSQAHRREVLCLGLPNVGLVASLTGVYVHIYKRAHSERTAWRPVCSCARASVGERIRYHVEEAASARGLAGSVVEEVAGLDTMQMQD